MRVATLIFITLLLSCGEIEIPVSFPIVITDEVEVIENTGARFTARIANQSSDPVVRYGFVWGPGRTLSLSSNRVVIDGDPGETFSLTVTRDLHVADGTFYARAFAQTSTNTIFGNAVGFKPMGSRSPGIVTMSPQEGFDETEVTLTLSNFLYVEGDRFTMTGGLECPVLSASDSIVKIKIPLNNLMGPQNITIITSGLYTISSRRFTILGPAVKTLPKEIAAPEEELIIAGEYLDLANNLEVDFEEHTGPIIPMSFEVLSPTELKVIVPNYPGGEGRIRLIAKVGNNKKTTRAAQILNIE